ncbi:MAG: TMEM165/GDT1 family protein [Methanomassiliicoccales archaeon]
MDLAPLLAAFFLILVTEIGDKSMLAIITLSSRYTRLAVFLGALSALAVMSLLAVLVGEVLYSFIPAWIVSVAAGILFIVAGLFTLLLPEKEEKERHVSARSGFAASFLLVALMEMGDKTQLSLIGLSAQSGQALLVLIGAVLAFTILVALEVTLGGEIAKRVPPRAIQVASGAIFLLFGIIFLAETLWNL